MKKKIYKLIKLNGEEKIRFLNLKNKYKNLHPIVLNYLIKKEKKHENFDIEDYLFGNNKELDDPKKIPDMEKGVNKFMEYICSNKEKEIAIVGDYDVDGIIASTILYNFTKKKFNKLLDIYIPEREEGYGLQKHIVEELYKKGKKLIITVDNGITSFEAVELANKLGMEVIITDHHSIQEDKIPNAFAVINPKRKENTYKSKEICGAGVIFNFCRCIDKNLSINEYTDILAVATVADVVPLLGDNRKFVKLGLKSKIKNKGLKKLIERLNIQQNNSTEIAFKIAPIINSSGRMGYANLILKLFISEEIKDEELDIFINFNEIRKSITNSFSNLNLEKYKNKYSLVLKPDNFKNNYNVSIVGIGASRIVEELNVPVIIFGFDIKTLYFINNEVLRKNNLKKYIKNNFHKNILNYPIFDKDIENIENVDIVKTENTFKKYIETLNKKIIEVKTLKNGIKILKYYTGFLKGSGRGTEWFDFIELINILKKKNILYNGGGHKMACGLTIHEEKIKELEEEFEKLAKKRFKPIVEEIYEIIQLPESKEDSKFVINNLFENLKLLEPFGAENQPPNIAYDIGNYQDLKILGKTNSHFSIRTEAGIRMIGWNKIKNNNLPNLSNKLFLANIVENCFVNEENKIIKYKEFVINDIIDFFDIKN